MRKHAVDLGEQFQPFSSSHWATARAAALLALEWLMKILDIASGFDRK
jgi:hypothetical protein